MKKILIIILLLSLIIFLYSTTYQRDQVVRYVKRYTSLTDGYTHGYTHGYVPDSLLWNVNPFIYDLEIKAGAPQNLAGYWDGADCSHFVSQCLQAGYIPMWENNYSNNTHFLGYTTPKELNLFAVEHFPVREDWNHCVFYNNFWLEEIFQPYIETTHYPYQSSYHSLNLCSDIYFLKLYFPQIQYSYEDQFNIYTPHGNPFVPPTNATDYWTSTLMNTYNYEYYPISYIGLNFTDYAPNGNNLYGYKTTSMKWRAADNPSQDYHKGDFQIFCIYKAAKKPIDTNFEIHYENTYNDTGRIIRYKHAAICNSGSGSNAKVSAHNTDHYNYNYDYYLPYDGSNSIIFYEVPDNYSEIRYPNLKPANRWGGKPLITVHSKTDTVDTNYFGFGDTLYIKFAFIDSSSIMIPDRFMVKLEKGENHSLIDSFLYNGISHLETKIDTFKNFIMPNVDSLRITVKLDAGDNQDYGDDWQRTWNEQTWVESNENDNEFSKMIYTKIPKPTNMRIYHNNNRGTINIQWDGDSSLIYKIYSSTTPYDGFEEDLSGTFNGNSWEAPQPSVNKFYYVIATDGRNAKESKSVRYIKSKRINREKK